MPKFSANLGFLWPGLDLPAKLQAAAKAGFRTVELHWPYEMPAADLRKHLDDAGLALFGLNTPVGHAGNGDFGLAAQPGREDEFRDTFRNTLEYARKAGASAIHVMAGTVTPETRMKASDVLVGNLVHAAASAPDMTLLLEPINQRDKPGYFYSTIAEAVKIIGAVGTANVKVMFDCYHVGVTGGADDVVPRLEEFIDDIHHVQIAAVDSRAEPDEGDLDYRTVFSALERLGYEGRIGCEYKPRGDTDEGLAWVKTLGVAL
ncbi:isomerase [Pseudohoeflea suaedae]|uniref:Isomerase n=1 Tax=Pseudohoeflea suaedae TaxID=877384 RepID=A0A4R5PLD9_9HYPH|nr:TIM barrel protein [Pseudohoeflea suaedae]TDH37742.1 isomerase [Pseudohoeflea suaedae]